MPHNTSYSLGAGASARLIMAALIVVPALRAERPLHEALRAGAVTAGVNGARIDRVDLTVRAPGAPVTVLVPVGTRFAGGSGRQTMVAVRPVSVAVPRASAITVTVPVACTNMALKVPASDDRLTVAAPTDRRMAALLSAAGRAHATVPVTQAAVWILTDNANYHALGTLRDSRHARAIREREAVQALMLFERAGLGVEDRSIWHERLVLANAVLGAKPTGADAGLRTWCARVVKGRPATAQARPAAKKKPAAKGAPAAKRKPAAAAKGKAAAKAKAQAKTKPVVRKTAGKKKSAARKTAVKKTAPRTPAAAKAAAAKPAAKKTAPAKAAVKKAAPRTPAAANPAAAKPAAPKPKPATPPKPAGEITWH